MGGEEFAIMLGDYDALQARKIADRIRASIAELQIQSVDKAIFKLTVSVGVAQLRDSDSSAQCLIARAVEAYIKRKIMAETEWSWHSVSYVFFF